MFSSFIKIDGEEHDLLILDEVPTDHKLRLSYYHDFLGHNYLLLNIIVITLFAIDRGNYDSQKSTGR